MPPTVLRVPQAPAAVNANRIRRNTDAAENDCQPPARAVKPATCTADRNQSPAKTDPRYAPHAKTAVGLWFPSE